MSIYPDEDEVRRVLSPFEARLIEVHQRAWQRWEATPLRATVQFARTLPTLLHEFIALEAAAEFGEDADVRDFEHPGSVKYLFSDRVLLRFKKGGPKGIGVNIQTFAEREFTDPRFPFPDKPNVWKVEACWFPNKLKTKLDRVAIVARDLGVRIWTYDLGAEAATTLLPMPLPIVPIEPARRPALVLIKGGADKSKQTTDK